MAMAVDDEQMAKISTQDSQGNSQKDKDNEKLEKNSSPSSKYANHKRTASGTVILTEDDDSTDDDSIAPFPEDLDPIEAFSSDESDEPEEFSEDELMKSRQPIKPKLNLSDLKFYDYSQSPKSSRKTPEVSRESPLMATQPLEELAETGDDRDKKSDSEKRTSKKVMRTAERALLEGDDKSLTLQKFKKRKSDSSHHHSKLLLTSPASKSAAGIKRSRSEWDKNAEEYDLSKKARIAKQ